VYVEHPNFLATTPDGTRILQTVTVAAFTPGTDLALIQSVPIASQASRRPLYTCPERAELLHSDLAPALSGASQHGVYISRTRE
jgi:hypothetical protein